MVVRVLKNGPKQHITLHQQHAPNATTNKHNIWYIYIYIYMYIYINNIYDTLNQIHFVYKSFLDF